MPAPRGLCVASLVATFGVRGVPCNLVSPRPRSQNHTALFYSALSDKLPINRFDQQTRGRVPIAEPMASPLARSGEGERGASCNSNNGFEFYPRWLYTDKNVGNEKYLRAASVG